MKLPINMKGFRKHVRHLKSRNATENNNNADIDTEKLLSEK